MKKQKFKRVEILILCFLIAVFLLLMNTQTFELLEYQLEDYRYQVADTIPANIFVVGIDEETINAYGNFSDWNREKVAELINFLNEEPDSAPKVILIDIGYYDERNAETDQLLIESIKNSDNVVLVSTATFGNTITTLDDNRFTNSVDVILYETPFEDLKNVAAAVGHCNIQTDRDSVVRHAFGDLSYQNQIVHSVDYEVVKLYDPDLTIDERFLSQQFYIDYSGLPRDYTGDVGACSSLYRVLNGEYPRDAFQNGIVIVGAYASGLQDSYLSGIDKSEMMYGAEIHANIINQMMQNSYKTECSMLEKSFITGFFALLGLLLIYLLSIWISVPIIVLINTSYFLIALTVYDQHNIVLPLLYPIAISAIIILTHILTKLIYSVVERKKLVDDFGKYLSPAIAKRISNADEIKLEGTSKDIAVLFVDIRGFTSLSEKLTPVEVVNMLNQYLAVTTKAIFQNEGSVDKFIGDATMGLFNAPLDLDDYCYKAVCAGLDMAKLSESMVEKLAPELQGRVGYGIGINCGEAVVGNIGTKFRMEYTAIGDTVNVASRLEGVAKAGEVIISEALYERIKDRFVCEYNESFQLKGKEKAVNTYKVIAVKQ